MPNFREESFNIEWILENFLSLSKGPGKEYISDYFQYSNSRFLLRVYPYGRIEGELSDWIALYMFSNYRVLQLASISFEFALKKADGTLCLQQTLIRNFYNALEHGIKNFLTRSELLRRKDELLTSDALTIVCRLRSFPPPTELNTAFANGLKDILDSYSDVTIRVKDQEFRAHKKILAASSPVFSAMFEHEMSEKDSGVVTIPDCEQDSFKGFLRFLYSSRTDITDNNVYDLYSLAHKYGVQELMIHCAAFMIKNLSLDNFCEVAAFQYQYSDENLSFNCQEYFEINVGKVLNTSQW